MRDRDALLIDLGSQIHALVIEARAFVSEAAENLQPAVSGSAFAALQWMHTFGPDKASRIADGLAMDRSIVSRLMKTLVRMALVEARPDELDGRVIRYGLSTLGRARVASAIADKDSAYRRRLQDWSDKDLATLAELLRRLVNDRGNPDPATRHR